MNLFVGYETLPSVNHLLKFNSKNNGKSTY